MFSICRYSLPYDLIPKIPRQSYLTVNGTELVLNVSDCTIEQSVDTVPYVRLEGELVNMRPVSRHGTSLKAKKVIYNNPATVVLWEDGTKTVVKCDSKDEYNPMLGLALCYMKKALGNSSRKLNDALHAEGF